MATIFACPVCSEGLHRIGAAYRCPQGHSYDIAKEGYVNLLLAHQRHSPEPGDSADMIRHRRAFLEADFYEPLARRITRTASDWIGTLPHDVHNFLDAGCGEGYFLRKLQSSLPHGKNALYGIDISRPAIRYAARSSPDINFAVGSIHRLPILPGSVHALLSILAPRDYKEWHRVTSPRGRLIVVVPGPYHLYGLRKIVYRQPLLHETESKLEAHPWFRPLDDMAIRYTLRFAPMNIEQLVSMTPYLWHLDAESQDALRCIDELETEVEFVVRLMERVT